MSKIAQDSVEELKTNYTDEFDDDFDDDFDDYNDPDFNDSDYDHNWGPIVQDTTIIIPKKQMLTNKKDSIASINETNIDDIQNEYINKLSEHINIDKEKCLILLRKYKWKTMNIVEKYLDNSDKLLDNAGIYNNKAVKLKKDIENKKEIKCCICLDYVKLNDTYGLECGHQFACNKCWINYLTNAVKSKKCIELKCPTYKCNIVIQSNVWKYFLYNKKYINEYQRYLRFCRENFVENNTLYSFCPGKNCDKIYKSDANIAKTIDCNKCEYSFCWKCKYESHLPVNCDIAQQWYIKCSSESENLQWILAKTKKCPKCGVHIEKNQGCNHMTCNKDVGGCGYEFCWLCKGNWKDHGENTGGFYECNIYKENEKKGIKSDEETKMNNAKNELERYTFHYTRYDSHYKSKNFAIKQKKDINNKMYMLANKFKWRLNEAQFLKDALNEVILCWHLLSITYIIGYYYKKNQFNLEIFKDSQAQLETFCDGLQYKIDFDLNRFGNNNVRQEVINYTRTAKKYRINLIKFLE